jgi:hypothetical protein
MIAPATGAPCSSLIHVQQRRTRRRLDLPAGPQGWRKRKGKGRGVECFHDDHSSDGCALVQHDTPDRSGEGCSLFQHGTCRRRVLAVPRRRARAKGTPGMIHPIDQAKGVRCSSMIPSGEGCSLSSDDALGRRVLAVQRRRTRAKGARCPATTHSAEGWI